MRNVGLMMRISHRRQHLGIPDIRQRNRLKLLPGLSMLIHHPMPLPAVRILFSRS
jgi:hypothetical protein